MRERLPQQLEDSARSQYLEAMGITWWVPKAHPEADKSIETFIDERAQSNSLEDSDSSSGQKTFYPNEVEREDNNSHLSHSESSKPASCIDRDLETKPVIGDELDSNCDGQSLLSNTADNLKALESNEGHLVTGDTGSSKKDTLEDFTTELKLKGYLKLVNWKGGDFAGKSVMVLCRHDTEQPAQSFARPHGPSQFMSDYLDAFKGMLVNQEVQFSMGHLAEAGLGENSVLLSDSLSELNPDLVLLLGDEAVKLLLGEQQSLAEYRGRVIQLADTFPTIISYHPYSLISEPSLKRLAYEDLKLAAKVFS
ncbi:hypothetical protein [Aliikangiella sp. G2MR2-5]|uniref:hypothetical protein n=1 Tax=Aliikangiella sp. G2MR2-5 TaxID=2788943 RepID=UPI0018AC3D1E|nr:hypothetical protein [Aliikangiella sp. G2MR2-5]